MKLGGVTRRDGATCSHVRTPTMADVDMMVDAMKSLPFRRVLETFEGHVAGRPDIDATALEQFANRVGRLAHMESRK